MVTFEVRTYVSYIVDDDVHGKINWIVLEMVNPQITIIIIIIL